MSSHRARRTTRRVLAVAGSVALLAGLIAAVVAVLAQRSAPQPPAAAASFVPVTPAGTSGSGTGSDGVAAAPSDPTRPPPSRPGPTAPPVNGPTLTRSIPVRLSVPAIGVRSPLSRLGQNPDGSVEVPPLGCHSHAGWYENSPTPGQVGPSVVLGHIDSAACGPGVFFRLGDLRQRDRISVTLADHTVAVFAVEKVVEYRKAEFPTLAVYGNTDRAELRLITCGGTFDPAAHSYESNIVVYAALVSSHHE